MKISFSGKQMNLLDIVLQSSRIQIQKSFVVCFGYLIPKCKVDFNPVTLPRITLALLPGTKTKKKRVERLTAMAKSRLSSWDVWVQEPNSS